MRVHDALIGLLFIVLAAAVAGFTLTFPAFPGQKYGPALFPRILAVGIILSAVVIILRSRNQPQAWISIEPVLRDPIRLLSFLAIPGAILFYLFAADWLGFIPVSFIILLVLLRWFGVATLTSLALAIGMTGVMNWFFGTMMRVPLPRGLFMQIVFGG